MTCLKSQNGGTRSRYPRFENCHIYAEYVLYAEYDIHLDCSALPVCAHLQLIHCKHEWAQEVIPCQYHELTTRCLFVDLKQAVHY